MTQKNSKRKDIYVFLFLAILMIFLVYFFSVSNIFSTTVETENKTIQKIQVNISSQTWNISFTSFNTSNITVADILYECAYFYDFSIEPEFFSGHDSFFITSINGIQNGENNSYWQFYVNEEYANKGCSQYYLKSNDIVEWKFQESPWTL